MDYGGRRRHMAAMGPHPRQQSTQQSTNIICDGSTLLKLEKKIFITSNMAINACRIDNNKQRRPCSNATIGTVQPAGRYRRFYWHVTGPQDISERGHRGGRGLGRWQPRYPSTTGGAHKGTGFFWQHDAIANGHHNSSKRYGTSTM
jgi:hypothetical protein